MIVKSTPKRTPSFRDVFSLRVYYKERKMQENISENIDFRGGGCGWGIGPAPNFRDVLKAVQTRTSLYRDSLLPYLTNILNEYLEPKKRK